MVMGQRRPRTLRNAAKPILPQQQNDSDMLEDRNQQQQRNNNKSFSSLNSVKHFMTDPTKRIKFILLLSVSIGLIIFHEKRSMITQDQLFTMQEYESKKKQQSLLKNEIVATTTTSMSASGDSKSFDSDPVNNVGDHSFKEEKEKESSIDKEIDSMEENEDLVADSSSKDDITSKNTSLETQNTNNTTSNTTKQEKRISQCTLRTYPKRRYYGLSNHTKNTESMPHFLKNTPYIHGKYPILLNKYNTNTKVCINSTSWEKTDNKQKFSDGQNPSIVHVNKKDKIYNQLSKLVDEKVNEDIAFVAVVTIGDSQCNWKNTPDEIKHYNLSSYSTPPTIRTLFLLLNKYYETIYQSTLYLHASSNKWGNRRCSNGYSIQQLDDARIFWYKEQLYVSYRNGKYFGYSSQVHNPIHVNAQETQNIYINTEESVKLDGGRNFAMFETNSELYALTWVDPVTVVKVNMDDIGEQLKPARITNKRSTIHGTNGMLVPVNIDNEDELLGIAHFHRPEDRQTSDYGKNFANYLSY